MIPTSRVHDWKEVNYSFRFIELWWFHDLSNLHFDMVEDDWQFEGIYVDVVDNIKDLSVLICQSDIVLLVHGDISEKNNICCLLNVSLLTSICREYSSILFESEWSEQNSYIYNKKNSYICLRKQIDTSMMNNF